MKFQKIAFFLTLVFLSTLACKQRNSVAKAIYGTDNRISPHKHSDPRLRELAQAIVLLTTNATTPAVNDGFCSGAIFATKSKNFLLTAGHCLKTQKKCDDTFIVFSYEGGIPAHQQVIVKCKQLIFTKEDPDVAIATISAPVYDKQRLNAIPLMFSNHQRDSTLAVIGHPEGGLKKIADNCKIEKRSPFSFSHQCDTFSGNSGSPMFDLNSYKLAGILVAGRDDKTPDGKNRIYRRGYEQATDVTVFQKQLVEWVSGKPPKYGGFIANPLFDSISLDTELFYIVANPHPAGEDLIYLLHDLTIAEMTKVFKKHYVEQSP